MKSGGQPAHQVKNGVGLKNHDHCVPQAAAQNQLMRWFSEGKLNATIAGTFDLAEWAEAFKLIEQRTVVGKAVLVP